MLKKRALILLLIFTGLSCNPYLVTPNFSEEYIRQNTDVNLTEEPSALELFHVVLAITEVGREDEYMIRRKGNYYQEVQSYFSNFENEKAVIELNKKLSKNPHLYHKFVKFFYNYQLKENKLIPKEAYKVKSSYTKYLKLFDVFAKNSDFSEFYKQNQPFYNRIIEKQNQLVKVDQMKDWLENEFSNRYQCYKIIFSPLTGGNHSTIMFKQNNYKEMLMFISAPILEQTKHSDNLYGALLSGTVFTEIDHNYVNPTSSKYRVQLKKALSNRGNWVVENTITNNYDSEYAVFNEYLTHALFCVYAKENFSQAIAEMVNQNRIKLMKEIRGFYRFDEFTMFLKRLREENPTKGFETLYAEIIDWFNSKNNN